VYKNCTAKNIRFAGKIRIASKNHPNSPPKSIIFQYGIGLTRPIGLKSDQ